MKFLQYLGALAVFVAGIGAVPAAVEPHPRADLSFPTDYDQNTGITTGPRLLVDAPAGKITGNKFLGVESFRGIPFAEPPTGQLRLKPPKRLNRLEEIDATGIAPACPQMFISNEAKDIISKTVNFALDTPLLKPLTGKEDCLTISVQRPEGTKAGDKLPVLFWMYGGGFCFGSSNTYEAIDMINRGARQNQPFVFVAVNYRVGGFGFMPGRELMEEGSSNLGLLDQRMGLEWVQDNIASFGGDPDRVTIWGESAGSMSVFNQMALYDGDVKYKGKDLFHGGIMNSGTVYPADPVDGHKGQAIYDQVVDAAGCTGQNDTLACLREADYDTFFDATNSVPSIISYNSLALSYLPRPDGTHLTSSMHKLQAEGRYHAVPMIVGDQEDEATLLAILPGFNMSTPDDIVNYLKDYYFHSATLEAIKDYVNTYDPHPSAGSPFRTGIFNNITPQFKLLAAILGDMTFTLTRRIFLEDTNKINPGVPSWSYLSSYFHPIPILGTFHASDVVQTFYGLPPNNAAFSSQTYYINFVNNLDPNKGVTEFAHWPQWKENHELMWFETGFKNSYLKDDFRSKQAESLRRNIESFYL